MKIKIMAKCSDCFHMEAYDDKGTPLVDYDGYVPEFMPGQHYGDNIILEIDAATGQILNWRKDAVELFNKVFQ